MAQHQPTSQNSVTSVTMNDYVQLNVGTLLLWEQGRDWRMAHSPWQGQQPGTLCLMNCVTLYIQNIVSSTSKNHLPSI